MRHKAHDLMGLHKVNSKTRYKPPRSPDSQSHALTTSPDRLCSVIKALLMISHFLGPGLWADHEDYIPSRFLPTDATLIKKTKQNQADCFSTKQPPACLLLQCCFSPSVGWGGFLAREVLNMFSSVSSSGICWIMKRAGHPA